MAGSEERSLSLGLWVLLLLSAGMEEVVEGCSCLPAHPQQLFCSSEIVIRAKISGEKIVSPSNNSSPYMKMIQYEIKMIKMFKGFDKAKDIQYVYTPVFSSLCGVKLDYNNKLGICSQEVCGEMEEFLLASVIWWSPGTTCHSHKKRISTTDTRSAVNVGSTPVTQFLVCPPERMSACGRTGCWITA